MLYFFLSRVFGYFPTNIFVLLCKLFFGGYFCKDVETCYILPALSLSRCLLQSCRRRSVNSVGENQSYWYSGLACIIIKYIINVFYMSVKELMKSNWLVYWKKGPTIYTYIPLVSIYKEVNNNNKFPSFLHQHKVNKIRINEI